VVRFVPIALALTLWNAQWETGAGFIQGQIMGETKISTAPIFGAPNNSRLLIAPLLVEWAAIAIVGAIGWHLASSRRDRRL
jgi:hypothetical protein